MAPPPVVQLACQLCQSKKLKCDKGNPCSNCDRAGTTCQPITRSRLPRGRNGGRKGGSDDLRDRVKRLEALVRGQIAIKSESGLSRPTPIHDPASPSEPDSVPLKYIGSTFWASLCNEVDSLRDVLSEEVPDDNSDSPTPSQPRTDQTASVFNFVLCAASSFMLTPGALKQPAQSVVNKLCDRFLHYVNPIFKVLHAPSLRRLLENGENYMGLSTQNPCIEALSYAVYYAAANTLDEPSCLREYGEAKMALLQRLHFSLEVFLVRADFINANHLPTLQAFTLFLAAHRLNDTSRTSWALLGLAVRIGQAMGLHHEPSTTIGVFEREMRRRLWHAICLLDAQNSMDRGTEPIISLSSFSTQIPLNASDADLSPTSLVNPATPDGFTDMTFYSMAVEGSLLFRQFAILSTSDAENTWECRMERAQLTKRNLETKYISKCDTAVPFQSFVQRIGQTMVLSAFLMMGRPMHRPVLVPPAHEKYKYLNLAVELLRQYNEMHDDPTIQGWLWFLWLPWHALAVALAELCIQDQTEMVFRAWPIVLRAYDTFVEFVADSSTGLLWLPIQKLMRKAQERSNPRQYVAHLSSDSHMHGSAAGLNRYSPLINPISQLPSTETNMAFPTGSLNVMDSMCATPPEDQAWQTWELFLDDMLSTNDFNVDASSYEAWSGQTGMQL